MMEAYLQGVGAAVLLLLAVAALGGIPVGAAKLAELRAERLGHDPFHAASVAFLVSLAVYALVLVFVLVPLMSMGIIK